MKKQSNAYIIIYATILVVVVAVSLTFTALKLQPLQQRNVEVEKKSAILASVGLLGNPAEAKNKDAYIADRYSTYIVESFLINIRGERVEGNAFDVLDDLKNEFAKPEEERRLPLFISRDDQGVMRYIIPVYGAGLWGPVWGYIALEEDMNTIYGAVFDHKGETPGLGAEIATPFFQNQFKGKTLFEGDRFVGISVLKGAGSSEGNNHAVDAISGGTITSVAVERMIREGVRDYEAFFALQRNAGNTPVSTEEPEGEADSPSSDTVDQSVR